MADPDTAPSPVVLFLCTGNYYRSRYAEILFNHLAAQRELPWQAESRGLDLALGANNVGPLSPHTRLACGARGLPLSEPLRPPLPVSDRDLKQARLVIALKEAEHRPYLARLFPNWAARVRYWHVHDLDHAPANEALREIDRLVSALIAELAAES